MFDPQITSQRLPYRDLNLRPRQSGGFDVQAQPNPNKGMGPYGGVAAGNYTMSEMPTSNFRPEILPDGSAALGYNAGLERRGMEATNRTDEENFARTEKTNIGVFRDPRWVALRQALFEAGSPGSISRVGNIRSQAANLNQTDSDLLAQLMR